MPAWKAVATRTDVERLLWETGWCTPPNRLSTRSFEDHPPVAKRAAAAVAAAAAAALAQLVQLLMFSHVVSALYLAWFQKNYSTVLQALGLRNNIFLNRATNTNSAFE